MAQSYKARKEAFVSNLSGGEVSEINIVTLVVPITVILWSALQSRHSFSSYGIPAVVTDFLLNVAGFLFASTLYASAPVLLNLLILSPAILILLNSKRKSPQQKAKPPVSSKSSASRKSRVNGGSNDNNNNALDKFPQRPFLTNYRGCLMIMTCLSILAVDFHVFPRRFAKVENWGTSLMDLGVGSFVFSGGVVSARAILKTPTSNASLGSLPMRIFSSMRHSIPLFVLGLVRLYSVKGLDYAEHVTEYGVHWNFFFTLGFMPMFTEIFHALTAIIPWYEAISLLVITGYQVALESTDLKEYIMVSPRGPSLLSKNREGVFSFIGYLAIFLAGRATGLRVIPRRSRKSILTQLAAWSLIWTSLFIFNSGYAGGLGARLPVSRRLANMPYVLWIIAYNNVHIFVFCLLETLFFPSVHQATDKNTEAEQSEFATSRIMTAFNKNGLPLFLIANLLTGAINLAIPTIDVSNWVAMVILIGYSVILTAVALALDIWNFKLKL